MRLATADTESLSGHGTDAVQLLCRGDIGALAQRYGYALSHGRDIATAIRDDLQGCLDQVGAASLAPAPAAPVERILFYGPERWNVLAVVECVAPTTNGQSLLVELVVTRSGDETHVTLEQISAPTVNG